MQYDVTIKLKHLEAIFSKETDWVFLDTAIRSASRETRRAFIIGVKDNNLAYMYWTDYLVRKLF